MGKSIIVSAQQPRGAELSRNIRQWVFEFQQRIQPKPTVEQIMDFAAVAARVNQKQEFPPIVVASGVPLKEIRARLESTAWPLCLLVGGPLKEREPLATPLCKEPFTVRIPKSRHLEKLALLQSVITWLSVRPLSTVEEMKSFLALRYRVWSQLDYIPKDRKCTLAQLEIDYSDRFSTALGAFIVSGGKEQLIGGIRIINEQLTSNPQWALIEQILGATTDPHSTEAISRAPQHAYPFDLLASFPAFTQTYRGWVRAGYLKAELSRVIVDPDYQRKGIGEVLVDSACAYARQEGLDLLFLACKEMHAPFYQRSGFQLLPGLTCESFATVKVPAVGMFLNL